MALGTLFGGWKIVRTMGSRITWLSLVQGVCVAQDILIASVITMPAAAAVGAVFYMAAEWVGRLIA